MVDDEARHVAQASWPRLCRAGPRASAQDHDVCRETLGSGNDFPLRTTVRDQIRDLRIGQSRREPLVPRLQKRGPTLGVRVRQTLFDRVSGMRRPEPTAQRKLVGRELPRPGLLDVEQSYLDRGISGAERARDLRDKGGILGTGEGH
jgi:hypothetical protein